VSIGDPARLRGLERPGTAAEMRNWAGVLRDLEEIVAARPLAERTPAIDVAVSGPDNPDCAADAALQVTVQRGRARSSSSSK
jgi:hypothetical protein